MVDKIRAIWHQKQKKVKEKFWAPIWFWLDSGIHFHVFSNNNKNNKGI